MRRALHRQFATAAIAAILIWYGGAMGEHARAREGWRSPASTG